MIERRWFGNLLLTLAILATPLLSARTGGAQEARFVTAAVECVRVLDAEGPLPAVEVTIENQSDLTLRIAYVQSFGTLRSDDGSLPGLSLAKPKKISVTELSDGERVTIEAPWNGGELKRSDTIVALIVTSAGVFLPACGDEEPQRMNYDGETPDGASAQDAESAAIAAATLGQLVSWLAYPVLYALLHPDARSEVPYMAMACWYDQRFGAAAGDERQMIYSTEVKEVGHEPWTWAVTGDAYEDSAVVSYEQVIGTSPDAEPTEASMHLVQVDGIWRWFFGGSAEAIAKMPKECGLAEFS
jgi:hypothetical protein